ncbi:DUF6325 family protein [Nocardioides sp. LHG3406-4]|uniref:DUF6325 family protein n=1 Tax=Nocardioides sp. LHG3406-4 TaxID=2804575 RepID=UPI003CEC0640
MTETPQELRGPIDFVLIEFQGDRLTGGGAEALLELVEWGIVSVYDIQVIGKDADGAVHAVELTDPASGLGGFARLAWAVSGLLDESDIAEAAGAMEPGTLAVLVVYENTWAIPFITAAWESGGRLIASARLAEQDVTRALDELDAHLTTNAGE